MSILVVDESDQTASALDDGIRVRGYQVARVRSCAAAESWCREHTTELCLVCDSPGMDATLARLSSLLESNATMRVLLISASAPHELAYHARVRIFDDETDLEGALQEVSSCMIAKHLESGRPATSQDLTNAREQYALSVGARAKAVGEALRAARAGSAPLDLARYLAHRIYGSAAAYGFGNLGQAAGELEELILEAFERRRVDEADWREFRAAMQRMNDAAGRPLTPSLADLALSTPPGAPTATDGDPQAHVLLVDDDSDSVGEITALLIDMNAKVSVVSSTRDLHEALRVMKPDLLVMSALMPGASGLDACRTLKGSVSHQQLPILLVTQRLGIGMEGRAYRAGADDVLLKPVHPQELKARVGLRLELLRLRRELAARATPAGRVVSATQPGPHGAKGASTEGL